MPAAEIEREVGERLKRLARTIRMHGFRPGKVPLKLVEQTYGAQVRQEVLGDAVQKTFGDAVRQQNLRVAGYPRFERNDGAPDGELQFSATFEVYPEVALGDLAGVAIERPTLASATPKSTRRSRSCASSGSGTSRSIARRRAGDRVTIDFAAPSTAPSSRAATARTTRSSWGRAACWPISKRA